MLDPLGLELQTAVSCLPGAGNLTLASARAASVLTAELTLHSQRSLLSFSCLGQSESSANSSGTGD
jgi:hypothetical protein